MKSNDRLNRERALIRVTALFMSLVLLASCGIFGSGGSPADPAEGQMQGEQAIERFNGEKSRGNHLCVYGPKRAEPYL